MQRVELPFTHETKHSCERLVRTTTNVERLFMNTGTGGGI